MGESGLVGEELSKFQATSLHFGNGRPVLMWIAWLL
jgi:hypothetical protein